MCGKTCALDAPGCPSCGTSFGLGMQLLPAGSYEPPPGARHTHQQTVKMAKSRGVYIILGLFFGMLGIHNFYAGRFGVAVAQMLIVLILGWFVVGLVVTFIWVLVDLFTVKRDGAGDAFA